MPTIKEIQRAIGRTSVEKAAGDNGTPAEFYQALASSEEGLEQIAQVIAESWRGTKFEEWTLSKLKILPKKGGFSDPNNWRPIMPLDVLQKISSTLKPSFSEGVCGFVCCSLKNFLYFALHHFILFSFSFPSTSRAFAFFRSSFRSGGTSS